MMRSLFTKRTLALALVGILATTVVLAPAVAQSGFFEQFNGDVAAPTPYLNPEKFDVFTQGYDTREPNVAQHGPSCDAPGFPYTSSNTHLTHSAADAVFLCGTGANTHMMTSPGLTGYGAVYFTPPAVMDFSHGSSTVSWDMSTLRTAARDWVDLVITPLGEHSDLAYNNNDQHIPPDNIHVTLAGTNVWLATERTNGSLTYDGMTGDLPISGDGSTTWDQVFSQHGLQESAIRRDTFAVTLTATTISVCMPGYSFCWINNAALPHALSAATWHGQAAVMFGHRSYNPEKSCSAAEDQFNIVHNPTGDAQCPPNTWHWDNISITPSVAFPIIQPTVRNVVVNSPNPTRVDFQAPAPAGSSLSFVSFGHTPDLRVSFDGGATWSAPHIQPANAPNNGASEENGEQIVTAIPQGVQSVMTKGSNGFWGTFEAEAFVILGPAGAVAQGVPTDTPVPAATRTPAATAIPTSTATASPLPSSTSTPASTATPTHTPTAAPTATSTVQPTVTPTPTPGATCAVLALVNGVQQSFSRPAEFCTDQ